MSNTNREQTGAWGTNDADWEPDILLVSIDALRADHLSCYGYDRETSPVLDDLASDGVRFVNAYSASSHTREAVPSLLTGKYPQEAVGPSFHLSTSTVGNYLSDYRTAAFHSNPYVSRAYGFDRGFETFDDDLYFGRNPLLALGQRVIDKLLDRHYARAPVINERYFGWLDRIKDRPTFAWLHYMDVHGPYDPPSDYAFGKEETTSTKSLYTNACRDPDTVSEDHHQALVDTYDGEIRYIDEQLGELIEGLKRRGRLSNTLLVVTADHGDAFGEHGYYGHPRYLHDEVVHIPLIIAGPNVPHTTIKSPCSTIDIVPTLLSATGIDTDQLPGIPLQTVARSPADFAERIVFSSARSEDEPRGRFAARDATDRCLTDLINPEQSTEFDIDGRCTERLRIALESHINRHDNSQETKANSEVTPTIEERLKALGYRD